MVLGHLKQVRVNKWLSTQNGIQVSAKFFALSDNAVKKLGGHVVFTGVQARIATYAG